MNTDPRESRDEDLREVMEDRLFYHQPRSDTNTVQEHEAMRGAARQMAWAIISLTSRSRHRALALTAVEEAMHWGNGAIAIAGGAKFPASGGGHESPVEASFALRAQEERVNTLSREDPDYVRALQLAGAPPGDYLRATESSSRRQPGDPPVGTEVENFLALPFATLPEALVGEEPFWRYSVRCPCCYERHVIERGMSIPFCPINHVHYRVAKPIATGTEPNVTGPEPNVTGPEPMDEGVRPVTGEQVDSMLNTIEDALAPILEDMKKRVGAQVASNPLDGMLKGQAMAMLTEDPGMAWRVICPHCKNEHFMVEGMAIGHCKVEGQNYLVDPPSDKEGREVDDA